MRTAHATGKLEAFEQQPRLEEELNEKKKLKAECRASERVYGERGKQQAQTRGKTLQRGQALLRDLDAASASSL